MGRTALHSKSNLVLLTSVVAVICLVSPASLAAATPEETLAQQVKMILGKSFNNDWQGLDQIQGIKWAPLPPQMLTNCMPDGGCFARQGAMTVGGRNLVVLASGARTIVSHVYFRNQASPIGADLVLAALKQLGFSADLARCPVPNTQGGTNWYRLTGSTTAPGYLAVQTSCGGKACEGFVVSLGDELPPLQPNQLKLYSEKCTSAAADRKPVSTSLPHEQLVNILVGLLPPVSGPALYDWKVLVGLVPGAQWNPPYPPQAGISQRSGNLKLSGREFSLLGSGTAAQVKTIEISENGLHPRGEDVLGLLRAQGLDVRLQRCGPVYTESINNWYSVTSPKTHPVMLRQSLRLDGKQVQDTYELRLDDTLPKRDPRDRDPGVNGCK
jgi:hypothetical protein